MNYYCKQTIKLAIIAVNIQYICLNKVVENFLFQYLYSNKLFWPNVCYNEV